MKFVDSQLTTAQSDRCDAARLHGHARRRQAVTRSVRTSLALGEMAPLDVQLALLKDVWSRMQSYINSRSRDQVAGSENPLANRTHHFHTSKFRHVAALKFRGVRYHESAAWEGRVGLPPLGRIVMPAGGSKSGWHRWQKPHFTHHHRSPQVGQIRTFMDTALL